MMSLQDVLMKFAHSNHSDGSCHDSDIVGNISWNIIRMLQDVLMRFAHFHSSYDGPRDS